MLPTVKGVITNRTIDSVSQKILFVGRGNDYQSIRDKHVFDVIKNVRQFRIVDVLDDLDEKDGIEVSRMIAKGSRTDRSKKFLVLSEFLCDYRQRVLGNIVNCDMKAPAEKITSERASTAAIIEYRYAALKVAPERLNDSLAELRCEIGFFRPGVVIPEALYQL